MKRKILSILLIVSLSLCLIALSGCGQSVSKPEDFTIGDGVLTGYTGKATTSLPAGTYIIKDGTGHNWYGEAEAFGSEGYYEIMTFGNGQQEVQLKKNYSSTITVNVQEDNPDAEGVGSDWESWSDF